MKKVILTTAAACRVARIDKQRFNEHVAAGRFPCAPQTVPGRARLFDPDDMLALWLFRDLMDDGTDAAHAGRIACAVSAAARLYPEAPAISYVQDFFAGIAGNTDGIAVPADQVPDPADWDAVLFNSTDIRKVTTFRIGKLRKIIAHYTQAEMSFVGGDDK
jgi:hypothetical protein